MDRRRPGEESIRRPYSYRLDLRIYSGTTARSFIVRTKGTDSGRQANMGLESGLAGADWDGHNGGVTGRSDGRCSTLARRSQGGALRDVVLSESKFLLLGLLRLAGPASSSTSKG